MAKILNLYSLEPMFKDYSYPKMGMHAVECKSSLISETIYYIILKPSTQIQIQFNPV